MNRNTINDHIKHINRYSYIPQKNEYPYTLKNFTGLPVLKKDGTPFKWGTIIPLIGGCSMGCSIATNKKPDFMLTYSGFLDNEKSLIDYWEDVPYFNLDEYDIPEYANKESKEEKKSLEDLKSYFDNVDFVNAVPPCAGLSSLNISNNKNNMARGANAIQNEWLYKSSKFILNHIKPKVLWGENAPALFTNSGKAVADALSEIANEFGYSFSLMKTNTMMHGIPQNRERTFYFFWNSESAPILNYVSKEMTPLIEFLDKIPNDAYHNEDNKMSHHRYPSYDWILKKTGKTHKEWVKEYDHTTLHGYLKHNGLLDDAIKYIKETYDNNHWEIKQLNHIKQKIANMKGWWDTSPYFFYTYFNAVISKNLSYGMHPTKMRLLNNRELIWLMGHPHDFNMHENKKGTIKIKQISQNVPVITASDWAKEVMKFINGELILSGEIYYRQNNKYGQYIDDSKKAKKLF